MSDQSARAKSIFLDAIERAPKEWPVFLEQACAGDAALRDSVEKLLRAQAEMGSFHEDPRPPFVATVDAPATSERPGSVIGPYKLLQQIGEGGMGTVFMAEQTQPVQRKVALKIIKPGMDSRQVIARFEAERQALAMMDHVNIARVFDGGTTGEKDEGGRMKDEKERASGSSFILHPSSLGRPYFVMELVHGVPITKYCDDNHLTPRERLELFVPVCQAIQHAHQKGIIHRDIKPSNVMVTLYDGKPVPKVIDFGVAKATEQKLTERTLFTQYGTMVGTLEYMSPEQAEMSALGVDTRSDIYSLGVLLYELLTGSTPLTHKRMKEAAYAEILRMIKEEEPPKPSTRLSDSGEALASISAQRHMEPAKLTKLVRGELDWIVMKTLEKDRNRRYETANGFAADVQRYLCGEAVQAVPPSVGYRFRKFARRNKAALAFTGLVLLILLTLTGGIGWNVRDRAARQTAVEQEVKLALKEAEEWQEQGKWPEALSAAKRAEGLLAGGGDELRERVHQLRKDLDMVMRLDDIRLLSSEWKDDKFDFESADQAYAQAFADYGIDVARLAAEEAAARIRERARVATALAAALDHWASNRSKKDKAAGQALTALAQSADPDPWRRQVREARRQKDVKALAALAASAELLRQPPTSLLVLAMAIRARGDVQSEIEMLRQAQRLYPGDFWINFQLAETLGALGPSFRDEQVSFLRAALAVRPQSIAVLNNLGNALKHQGKVDQAIAHYHKAIELDPKFVRAYNNLGIALIRQGMVDEAIACYHKAIDIDPKNAPARNNLGSALFDQDKLDEAIAAFRTAIDLDPKSARYHSNLGNALAVQGRLDEAVACCDKAIGLDPKYADAHDILGSALFRQGKLDEAIDSYRRAIKLDPKRASAHRNLGIALSKQRKLDEAIAEFRKAIELDPKYVLARYELGLTLAAQQKLPEAVDAYHKAIEFNPKYADAYVALGLALAAQRKLPEAIDAYNKAIEFNPKYAKAFNNLGNALRAQQKLPEAIDAYRKAIELDPKSAIAHNNLGAALIVQNKLDEGIAEFREAIKLDPKYADAHYNLGCELSRKGLRDEAIAEYRAAIRLNPDWAEAHYGLGVDLKGKGLLDEAIAEYRAAIRLNKNDAQAHGSLGHALYVKGQLDEAIAECREALRLKRDWPEVHLNLGSALSRKGQHDEAISEYRESLRLIDSPEAHYGLALSLKAKGRLDEAIAEYREVVRLKPDLAVWHYYLGNTLKAKGDLDGAERAYREAVRLDGKHHGEAIDKLAELLLSRGNLKEGIATYQKIIILDPKDASAHDRLAWLLATCPDAKVRDPGRAVELARKAVQLEQKQGLYWQTLGYAEYRAGNWESAIAALEKVKALGSTGDSLEWYPLAMAHWRLGEKEEARMWYDKAVAWMEKNQPKSDELSRLRAEAAELLGIEKMKN